MALGVEVGLGPGHIVLDGDPAPSPKRGWTRSPSPIFGPFLLWPNGWMHQDATWYGGRSQPGDFVLDGDPAPLPTKGVEPPRQFLAHFYCGQTVGCIKMPLGMEVGLSPGDFVLDGDPSNFRPMFIIVIVISLEHCIIVTGLLKFKFKFYF